MSLWAGGISQRVEDCECEVRPQCREICVLRLSGHESSRRGCPHSLPRRRTPQSFKMDKRQALSRARPKDFGKSGQVTCLALTAVEIEHKASLRHMLMSLNHCCSEPLPMSKRERTVGLMKKQLKLYSIRLLVTEKSVSSVNIYSAPNVYSWTVLTANLNINNYME